MPVLASRSRFRRQHAYAQNVAAPHLTHAALIPRESLAQVERQEPEVRAPIPARTERLYDHLPYAPAHLADVRYGAALAATHGGFGSAARKWVAQGRNAPCAFMLRVASACSSITARPRVLTSPMTPALQTRCSFRGPASRSRF